MENDQAAVLPLIATLTTNPSIHQHILIDRLVKDDAIRAREIRRDPGGVEFPLRPRREGDRRARGCERFCYRSSEPASSAGHECHLPTELFAHSSLAFRAPGDSPRT
jgi:hypothetical protein